MLEHLKDYEEIDAQSSRLGDIVVFSSTNKWSDGSKPVHSCVVVAPGIVFSKGSYGPMSPFVLQKLETAGEVFMQPIRGFENAITYYRRKSS